MSKNSKIYHGQLEKVAPFMTIEKAEVVQIGGEDATEELSIDVDNDFKTSEVVDGEQADIFVTNKNGDWSQKAYRITPDTSQLLGISLECFFFPFFVFCNIGPS